MTAQKRLRSLEDLKTLLPDAGPRGAERADNSARGVADGKGRQVHIRLETGGRKGKAVTVISGLHLAPRPLEDLARDLKQHCGAGGTVKDDVIEIQGDQRERITAYLSGRGYTVR